MLSLLGRNDYHLLRPLAASPHLALVIDAMIAHPIPAMAWADDPVSPRTAFIWDQAYGYYFLGSQASRACLFQRLMNGTVLPQARAAGRDIGIFYYSPDDWAPLLPELLPGISMKTLTRSFYAFEASAVIDAPLPPGYQLRSIDAALLADERIEHREDVLAELRLMWARPEDFLEIGFGWCVLHESSIACWCTAEYLSAEKCGIGIATREEHRRKGLATTAATAVVRESLSHGLTPHWDCWATNLPSARVAEKVGFTLQEPYAIYLGQLM
ncbi:MAG: GNAT family N-acetyltransferase [Armatimonadota bacterium]